MSAARRSSTPRASSRPPPELADAADVISRNPVTIQLRYLQTLREIGNQQNSTIVFPLPMDILQPLLGAAPRHRAATGPERERLDEALTAARAALTATTGDHEHLGSGEQPVPASPASEPPT